MSRTVVGTGQGCASRACTAALEGREPSMANRIRMAASFGGSALEPSQPELRHDAARTPARLLVRGYCPPIPSTPRAWLERAHRAGALARVPCPARPGRGALRASGLCAARASPGARGRGPPPAVRRTLMPYKRNQEAPGTGNSKLTEDARKE